MQRKNSEHSASGAASTPREVEHAERGGQSSWPGGGGVLMDRSKGLGKGCARQMGQTARAQARRKEGTCLGIRTLIRVQHGIRGVFEEERRAVVKALTMKIRSSVRPRRWETAG